MSSTKNKPPSGDKGGSGKGRSGMAEFAERPSRSIVVSNTHAPVQRPKPPPAPPPKRRK